MKRVIMIFVLATIISLSGCNQRLDATKVPADVKIAFTEKFPGATAEWVKENSNEYEAEFKVNEKSASANFLTDGSWVETEMEEGMAGWGIGDGG